MTIKNLNFEPLSEQEAIDVWREEGLHEEGYHLNRLGEERHEGSIKFCCSYTDWHYRHPTIESHKERINLQRDIFTGFSKWTKKERMRKRKDFPNYFISYEIGRINRHVHPHTILYPFGFTNWEKDRDRISQWLIDKWKQKGKGFVSELSIYNRHIKQEEIVDEGCTYASYKNYICKKEKFFNKVTGRVEVFDGEKFFSSGLKKTLLELN